MHKKFVAMFVIAANPQGFPPWPSVVLRVLCVSCLIEVPQAEADFS